MTRPPVPTIEALRGEDSAANITAARQRAILAMCQAPAPWPSPITIAGLLGLLGVSPSLGAELVHRMAAAYDHEMCAEWARFVRPIDIKPPKPRWRRWLAGFLGAAMPWLAGYGAFLLCVQIVAAVVEAVE